MNGYILFWSIVVFFSLISFTVMSLKMLIKGIPELREMFNQLGGRDNEYIQKEL